jgi:hypothetical protein
MKYKDALGNTTTDYSDIITLDTAKPTATINYAPPSITNQNVIATLT